MERHCLRAMSVTLVKRFESFAECCLELAQSADATAARARLVQMECEYRQATSLIQEKPDVRRVANTRTDGERMSVERDM